MPLLRANRCVSFGELLNVLRSFTIGFITVVNVGCAISPQPKAIESSDGELTIDILHQELLAKKTNCVRITQTFLDRISRYDQPTKLNAITVTNPHAIEQAHQLDKDFETNKKLRPLHCVPVLVKDNVDTIDMPTSSGSLVFKNFFSQRDAAIVSSLKNDGAIILAKTNMSEWAFSPHDTVSSSYGITRNAYDLQRVPAGSSGGTASGIAANFAIIGVGTDTGNSIRGPASHLSLVGLRPTSDRNSTDGVAPLLKTYDTVGLMTRTVEDLAHGLDSIMPLEKSRTFRGYLKKDGLQNVRIGVLRAAISDTADFEIVDLFEQALLQLQKRGAILVDPVDISNFETHRRNNTFCNRARYDLDQYFASLGTRSPVTSIEIIARNKAFAPQHDAFMEWLMKENRSPEEQSPPCGDAKTDPRRKAFRDAVVNFMQQHKLDAIIYPTWNNPPQLLDDADSPTGNNSSLIAPHTGQPAITVPMGFTNDGLPTGLQMLGKPNHDEYLIQYAYAYEQASKHRRPPSLFMHDIRSAYSLIPIPNGKTLTIVSPRSRNRN